MRPGVAVNDIFWVDLETTGVDSKRNGIVQIAAMIERAGKIVDAFNMQMNPGPLRKIDPEALEVNGLTVAMIQKFQPGPVVYRAFRAFLGKWGKPGRKDLRFIPAGYNVGFDLDFLSEWHREESGGPYAFWDFLQYLPIDPYPTIVSLWRYGLLPTKDCKLVTVAEYYGIPIDAHDAMSDIKASRAIAGKVFDRAFSSWREPTLDISPF
jgi:DNA polymerase-3 subunit epsilon